MAGGMVGEAFFGLALEEGAEQAKGMFSKAWRFKSTRRTLASFVERVMPFAKAMRSLDEELDRPTEDTDRLMQQLQQAQELVDKRSDVPFWKFCCLPWYEDELQDMGEELRSSLAILKQNMMPWYLAKILRVSGTQFNINGLCKPPEKPEFTVGLDRPLNKLKNQLLESGTSVFVLTGLAGSGKSTLATLLCHHEQVKGKFRENILFVTVSKTPNLKIVVQTLFRHCGSTAPDFLSDEHALSQLKLLLRKIGENPIMLVLDDVWHGSESLIHDFVVELSDYKILVTSRFEFPGFGSPCQLEPLSPNDAVTLFRYFANPRRNDRSYIPDDDFVQQVATSCWGSPLALKLIGRSLSGKPIEMWQKMKQLLSKGRSILDSDDDLLSRLQKCLDDVLEDRPIIKECFMDIGLFPEDQKIPVAALIDMWTELYELDDGSIDAMKIVYELTTRHLVNLVVTREVASEVDNYYNHHFLMQHDLLREIAIHQARQEQYEQRKRLIFDLNENNWPLQNQQQSTARTLSISTDEMDTPDWCNMLPVEVLEVLVLNLRTIKYSLPKFMEKMRKLKVLAVTNYDGFHFSELNNSELLGSLSSLKAIRLQQVSVPFLGKLINLRKLSLYMCNTSQAFQSATIPISDALPNLEELSIDYSKYLVELPAELCAVTSLKKLSITKCSNLSVLPHEIGNMKNLEILRLSSCSKLAEIPASVGRLGMLGYLDISYCVSLGTLPDEIGELGNLRKLHMTGCSECKLSWSVTKLENLKVICDEETAASWGAFAPMIPNLKIEVPKVDVNLNWLHPISS